MRSYKLNCDSLKVLDYILFDVNFGGRQFW